MRLMIWSGAAFETSEFWTPNFWHFRRCNLDLQGGGQVPRAVST